MPMPGASAGLSLASCFQEPCWTTWWGRRPWPTTFSTPSTGTGSLGECGVGGWAGRPDSSWTDIKENSSIHVCLGKLCAFCAV